MTHLKTLIASTAISLLLAACLSPAPNAKTEQSAAERPEHVLRSVTLTQINIPNAPKGVVNERGVISVPTNRTTNTEQMIDIEFFRFNRTDEADPETPPMFLLRGGPGYPGLGSAVENEKFYETSLSRFTKISDLIIIGQRGFGTSGDTQCPEMPSVSISEVEKLEDRRQRKLDGARACRDFYAEKNTDMSGYNVSEMADDVIELSRALGYDKIQLQGTSFGSFWAMQVIRKNPNIVARATLSALEGPDHTFDQPSEVKSAFVAMASAASESERYGDEIPEIGLIQAYQNVIAVADKSPIHASFVNEDTQQEITVNIDGDGLRLLTFGVSRPPRYSYLAYSWPEDLLKIINGDYESAARRLHRVWTWNRLDNAAETVIECSSGISAKRRKILEQDPATELLGQPELFDDGICDVWADYVTPMDTSSFSTSVPVVLVHGNWDISTPFSNSEAVRAIFDDHHFITVENGFHGALYEAAEKDPDFIREMNHWYATGERDHLRTTIPLKEISWLNDE